MVTHIDSDYPRLLIINGTPIGHNSGTGITLHNLFSKWPDKRIMQLCYYRAGEQMQGKLSYMSFPSQTAYIDHIIREFFRAEKVSRSINKDANGMNPSIAHPTLKGMLHDFVRAILDDTPIQIPKDILNAVDTFRPHALYSNLAGLRILKTVLFFAQRYNISIAAHFMDDWPATIYTTSVLSRWANKKVEQQIRRCLSLSNCSLAISEYMAEEYQRRYRTQFTWASNSVDIPESTYSTPDDDRFVLVYCGGLHLNRWKSLKVVAEALERLKEQGYNVSLEIYTSEEHRLAFQPQMKSLPIIKWKGQVRPDQVSEVLRSATALAYVEAFDEHVVNYVRYSFSTKMSEYLASGRPILAFAPLTISSTRYLQKYGVGIVANTPEMLDQHLHTLIVDAELRHRLGYAGFQLAAKHHSRPEVQHRLLTCIQSNATKRN